MQNLLFITRKLLNTKISLWQITMQAIFNMEFISLFAQSQVRHPQFLESISQIYFQMLTNVSNTILQLHCQVIFYYQEAYPTSQILKQFCIWIFQSQFASLDLKAFNASTNLTKLIFVPSICKTEVLKLFKNVIQCISKLERASILHHLARNNTPSCF